MFSLRGAHIRLSTSMCALVLILVLPRLAGADESSGAMQAQPDRISTEYVTGYLTDTGNIVASPAHWDGNDWLKAGAVVAATTGIYLADRDIKTVAHRNQSASGDSLASVGNALGNPLYVLPPLGLFYLYGHFADDPKARRTALLAVESLTISGVFTVALKQATQRPRPQSGEFSDKWYGPRLNSGDYSFPSNHTAAAFSLAAVIAEEYGGIPSVPPVAYGLASLALFARVYDNKHWASDAFFGGAIGYFVGKSVVRYHTQSTGALTILPTVSLQGLGVTAQYRF